VAEQRLCARVFRQFCFENVEALHFVRILDVKSIPPMSDIPKDYTYQISVIAGLFFVLGFVTWLNSILIPYLRIACELTHFEAYLVTFASYIAYFFMAIPSSWILKRTGLVNGMALALLVIGVGALLFLPAAT